MLLFIGPIACHRSKKKLDVASKDYMGKQGEGKEREDIVADVDADISERNEGEAGEKTGIPFETGWSSDTESLGKIDNAVIGQCSSNSTSEYSGKDGEMRSSSSEEDSVYEFNTPEASYQEGDSFKNKVFVSTGIKLATLSDLTASDLPLQGEFVKELQAEYVLSMEKHMWDNLISHHLGVNQKTFKGGSWQPYFICLIKQANPWCSIMFKRHRVFKTPFRAPRTNLLFRAEGYCSFANCAVKKVVIIIIPLF